MNLEANKPYVMSHPSRQEVAYVAARIRAEDRFEFAAHATADIVTKTAVLIDAAQDAYVALLGDEPVFIFGTYQVMPGVRQLFGFGTPRTKRVMPAVTWFTKSYWLPEMHEAGVRRIQVHVPRESKRSVTWLKSFGMVEECELRDYAATNATMLQMVFARNEFNKHVSVQQKFPNAICGSDARSSSGEVECRHSS